MISSNSNNIVYSSSKWLQKIGGGGARRLRPPSPPLKSASEDPVNYGIVPHFTDLLNIVIRSLNIEV